MTLDKKKLLKVVKKIEIARNKVDAIQKKKFTKEQLAQFYRLKHKGIPNKVIKKFLKEKSLTLYGGMSHNLQLPKHLKKHTKDFDIYSKTPKKTAREIEKRLDKAMGGNFYYTTPARFKNTMKVKSFITENTIADATFFDKEIPTKNVQEIKMQTVDFAGKRSENILKDKSLFFRHPKEREFLRRLKARKKK